jgi:ParB family chromosome partitioning protein
VAQQRRGLGRGLGALIPETPRLADSEAAHDAGVTAGTAPAGTAGIAGSVPPAEVFGAHFKEIPVSAITPNPRQPRRTFDEDAIEELAESIRQVGLLQPVVVRAAGPGRYELIMGERRWRASQRAGLTEIDAIVRQTQDNDLLRDALIENLHRQQLDPLEEAAAYQQLLDDFGATHEQLAQKIGRSRPHISNTLRLLNLPPAVQKRVAAGVLSAGHARALLGLSDPLAQERLATRIVAEGLSVRSVEEIVSLSADDAPRRRSGPAGRQPVAPGLLRLADRLSDLYETRVKVEQGRHKGKIIIEYATLEDLERIINAMTPDSTPDSQRPLPGLGAWSGDMGFGPPPQSLACTRAGAKPRIPHQRPVSAVAARTMIHVKQHASNSLSRDLIPAQLTCSGYRLQCQPTANRGEVGIGQAHVRVDAVQECLAQVIPGPSSRGRPR